MFESMLITMDRKVVRNLFTSPPLARANTPFRLVFSAGTETGSTDKYVYDSSTYTNYKKLLAYQKNYNDTSSGGANNGAQVALSRVRH
jgi:hypothetical protein